MTASAYSAVSLPYLVSNQDRPINSRVLCQLRYRGSTEVDQGDLDARSG